ncbi:signal peptide peptidase SppA [Luteococcus sp. OSA5]|uniref:signal peptide peptidase SppA n=1 Tax=Luteococcus sp. OSA5 TaxID=3401630 RepID=UPI003B4339D6
MDLSSPLIDRIISRTPLKGRAQTSKVILEVDLARGVLSAAPENPLAAVKAMNAPTMKVLRERLRKAADDGDVRGLVVHCGTAPITLTQAQELGLAIAEFAAKKPTLAFAHGFGELANDLPAYTLATACKQVWIQPSGQVGIGGIHLGITLAKGLLGKLGIDPQMSKRHEFKSAADRLAADHVTEANREMMQAIANSLAHDFVETVAERRGIDRQQVWDAVNDSPLTPQQALDLGLVDRIGYRDEALAHVFEEWAPKGTELGAEQLRFVHRWHAGGPGQAVKEIVDRKQPVVAVVGLRGAIVTGRGRPAAMGEPQAGADVVCEHLRAAGRDEKVKAVVLRIDTPGGSAVASDTIWRAVHQLRASGRPVVAQMGDLAASGGYYSAMGADEIVALPATLTGSIGVLAGKLVTTGLYQKLGLVHEAVESGENAGFLANDQYFTEHQWAKLNEWLDRIYDEFTHKAAADRGMDHAQLEPLARGRVWTGRDAQARGLVDHLGGMDVAIERACQLAGLKRHRIQLRAQPALGMLDRIRPADSTEQPTAASMPALTPESMLQQAAGMLGLQLQAGALEIPRLQVR